MSTFSTNTLETAVNPVEASWFETSAIGLASRLPGFRGLSASNRVLTALRGGAWTLAGYGAGQILRLISTLVLARMVAPQVFGLVALVNVFLSGLEMLSDLGIGMDVIQHRRGDDPVFINTAFLIQAGRAVILWAIAAALAYPFAAFYRQPVVALAVVGSLSVLVRGLASGSVWSLTRHVKLRELTFLNAGSDLFGLLAAVIWAVASPTAWALVVGRVASAVAFTVASHWMAETPVSTEWDSGAAREILVFGGGILLSTATYFLGGESERLVIGKFISLVELGCFSLALSISSAASRGLQQVIAQVFFPMISDSIRRDADAAMRHYRKTRHVLLILCALMLFGFTLGGKWIVKVLLGQKYAMAGWMLQLLGVRGALEVFISVACSMLFALGTAKYAAVGNVSKLVFLGIGLSIAFSRFGFREALWVLALAPLATYLPVLIGLRRYCGAVLRTEIASFTGFATLTVLALAICGLF